MADATIAPSVVSGSSPVTSTTKSSGQTLADNFQTFLTLLTTQLKNQNPLDPLDTNQFTQQLVQFAQVEQQLKSNDQLSTLVSLQQTAQATQALNFVGSTAVVDGSTAALTNGTANWTLNAPKPVNAHVTITSANGQTVFSGDYTVNAGNQAFQWNGRGNDGTQWPDGKYTITATGKDTAGNNVGIAAQVQGTVSSVDLTQSPPLLSIDGNSYTLSQVKSIVATSSN